MRLGCALRARAISPSPLRSHLSAVLDQGYLSAIEILSFRCTCYAAYIQLFATRLRSGDDSVLSASVRAKKKFGHTWGLWCDNFFRILREKLDKSLPAEDKAATDTLKQHLCQATNEGVMPDFSDKGAQVGYTLRKLKMRGGNAMRLLMLEEPRLMGEVRRHMLLSPRRRLEVASVGGGPGFDGVSVTMLATFLGVGISTHTTVYDYEAGWEPAMTEVSRQLRSITSESHTMSFARADITLPLDDPSSRINAHLASRLGSMDLLIFSYVLHENAQAIRKRDFIFFRQLLRSPALKPGTVLLFMDSSHRLWPEIVEMAADSYRVACPRTKEVHYALCLQRNFRHTAPRPITPTSETGKLLEQFRLDDARHQRRLQKRREKQDQEDDGTCAATDSIQSSSVIHAHTA